MANHLTPSSAQEASLKLSNLLAWLTITKDLFGLKAEEFTHHTHANNILKKMRMMVMPCENEGWTYRLSFGPTMTSFRKVQSVTAQRQKDPIFLSRLCGPHYTCEEAHIEKCQKCRQSSKLTLGFSHP